MNKRTLFATAAAVSLSVAAFGPIAAAQDSMDAGDAADATLLIGMKGPGAGNPFWAAVEAGALQAGEDYGVTVNILAPPVESDVVSQINQIEDAIAAGVDGIALAPTDPAALAVVVDEALAEVIPVVFIDTQGENPDQTFIGTNNEVGAALAGQYLCDNLEAGDKVAILQGIITQSTGQARANGGRSAVTECGLDLVAEIPAEWDTAKGQAAMEDILTGNPDLKGVFASNDNMALGAVEAIAQAGLTGEIVLVGFDANPNAAEAVLAGTMNATIAQNPTNMGKFGIESLIKLLNGETLDAVIDTGTVLVTAENAADFTG